MSATSGPSLPPALLVEVDGIVDRFLEGRHIPGLAIGIVAGGALVHDRGIGVRSIDVPAASARVDADTVFRIASMTKSFTAATLVSLRDEGVLALDDPVARYVPELADLRGPTRDAPPITIRHLLTMSSGLATDDPWGDRQQSLDLRAFTELLRGPLTFAWTPGTRFEYSNLGYGILGRVITNVAGREYREVVRERILDPLGLASTGFLAEEVPPDRLAHGYLWRDGAYQREPMDGYGALASMGGIFSTVRDLSRWVAWLAEAFPPRDDPDDAIPLSRASRREMQQVHRDVPADVELDPLDAPPTVIAGGYGFGLGVADDSRIGRIVAHSGGYPGYGSNMRWHPASGVGVVVLANHRYAPSTRLAAELLVALVRGAAAPARMIEPAPALVAAREVIGRLFDAWDDDVADRLFAMNVELDEPVAARRRSLEAVRAAHGMLQPDPDLHEDPESPLYATWWLVAADGTRVKVELGLSPEGPPRVQTFDVTVVPVPPDSLTAVVSTFIAAANAGRPPELATAGSWRGPSIERTAAIVSATYAPLRVLGATSVDGDRTATWRAAGAGGSLEVRVALEEGTGLVRSLQVLPRLRSAPAHGV